MIRGFHGGKNKYECLLRYIEVQFGRCLPTITLMMEVAGTSEMSEYTLLERKDSVVLSLLCVNPRYLF